MLKKSINSASICCDSRKRGFRGDALGRRHAAICGDYAEPQIMGLFHHIPPLLLYVDMHRCGDVMLILGSGSVHNDRVRGLSFPDLIGESSILLWILRSSRSTTASESDRILTHYPISVKATRNQGI
jgi:hypothetical protein